MQQVRHVHLNRFVYVCQNLNYLESQKIHRCVFITSRDQRNAVGGRKIVKPAYFRNGPTGLFNVLILFLTSRNSHIGSPSRNSTLHFTNSAACWYLSSSLLEIVVPTFGIHRNMLSLKTLSFEGNHH